MQKQKNSRKKIILGIDPGMSITGYGILSIEENKPKILQYGVIHIKKYDSYLYKLKKIYDRLLLLVEEYNPDEIALEGAFYGKNVQSMLKLGRVQGIAMAVALSKEIPFFEYAPRKIKQSITGNGNASKEQVAKMLITLLDFNITTSNFLFDATDALGVALCHFYSQGNVDRQSKSWNFFLKNNPEQIK